MRISAALLGLCVLAPSAWSCAVFSPEPENVVVPLEESALIVWDEKNGVEHFIRRADFSDAKSDIGFVVPSPSKPTLAPVDGNLFAALEKEIQPEVKIEREMRFAPTLLHYLGQTVWAPREESVLENPASAPPISTGTTSAIEVVERTHVGDYDAVVLRASDAGAVRRWLRDNSFQTTDASQKWLEFYTAKNWFLTAFKVRPAREAEENLSLQPVRISFPTDAPFYPYHEPKTAKRPTQDRSLRVFFVGPKRTEAEVVSPEKRSEWTASVPFSAPLRDGAAIREFSGMDAANWNGANLRMTTFDDRSAPRNGFGDLYFSRAQKQDEIRPEPIIRREEDRIVYLPLDLLLLAVAGVSLFVVLRRR